MYGRFGHLFVKGDSRMSWRFALAYVVALVLVVSLVLVATP